ncbi:MAG: T9SS type A sorting domain-containing protein, partial [Legionellales bacterium]|nr:T9SS type A sorting domain-containing protein [Legionellales bacterium]
NCININATNIQDAVYNTSSLVLTDLKGLFCLPNNSTLTSFVANITGTDSCGDPYSANITINIEQDCCNDEPYIEPYWDFCDSYNVCELDEWPIRVLDAGNPLLLLDGYSFSWTLNGVVLGTSDALFGAVSGEEYELTITYPNGCTYTLTYYKKCCADVLTTEFIECPQDINNKKEYTKEQYNIVSQLDIESTNAFYKKETTNKEDCNPCDADVPVVYTSVLLNGTPVTNFQSVVLSWPGNTSGVPINMSGFFVYTDILYTVTVTILDFKKNKCIYTYDFIYKCETECKMTAPTNLHCTVFNNATQLRWNPVPGAIGYELFIEANSPKCCPKGESISLIPIKLVDPEYHLPANFKYDCFAWKVRAICENEEVSLFSEYQCFNAKTKCPILGFTVGDIENEVLIFPNPSKGIMDIKVNTNTDTTIKIYKFDGTLVKTISNLKTEKGALNFNLNLQSELTSGIYFFIFNIGENIISKKVIIE